MMLKTIIFTLMITLIKTEIQILDYTNAHIVTIETGMTKLVAGDFKLIHVIDLGQYERTIDELETIIRQDIGKKNNSYEFLLSQIQVLYDLIANLKPRRELRAINALGTLWKWVAGSPDHEDFKIVTDSMNKLLENNNKQIVINRSINTRIQEISNITNSIINNIGSNDAFEREIVKDVERKLEIIKNELTNLGYSIQWAKAGIINSFILSEYELNMTRKHFNEFNMPYINLIEALEFGEVKIGMNKTTILYMINLPITEKETCNSLFIKPVKRLNVSIKIDKENFVLCKNSVLEVKAACRRVNDVDICNDRNLENITESNCLPRLLNGLPSECPTSNNQHLPVVNEIAPGIMLLNGYDGSITTEDREINITGTFIIKYHNSTITIGGKKYSSKEISMMKPLPAVINAPNTVERYEEMLSLEMLKELNINNSGEIKKLATNYRFSVAAWIALIMALIGALTFKLLKRKACLKINNDEKPVQPVEASNTYIHYPSNEDAGKLRGEELRY